MISFILDIYLATVHKLVIKTALKADSEKANQENRSLKTKEDIQDFKVIIIYFFKRTK